MITKANFVFGISSRAGSSEREFVLFLFPKPEKTIVSHIVRSPSRHDGLLISSSFVLFFQAVKILKLIKFKKSP